MNIKDATDEQRAARIAALEAEGEGYKARSDACKAAGETEEAKKYADRFKAVEESRKAWQSGGKKKPAGADTSED